MDRLIWQPGGKGGGGRYVPLSELVREYLPQEPEKPFYGPPMPQEDNLFMGLYLAGACGLGIFLCYGLLWMSGVVR